MRPYTPTVCIPTITGQPDLRNPDSRQLDSPQLDSPQYDSPQNVSGISKRMMLARVLATATALLLALTLGQGKSYAQQTPDNGQYAAPYDPNQQSGYNNNNSNVNTGEQPGYPEQDPYGQEAYPEPASPTDTEPANEPTPALSAPDLEQLVAPIALYPDALVAQVLMAATYPLQVSQADHWLRAQGYAPAEEIVAGADAQPWDPSVKALTEFPQVLTEMDQNLNWTTELGNAYYNQPQDVLHAVQVMRQRAQAAGNLRSTPQESVSYDQGNIVLAPANPQVVYVPAYNPWAVYGEPVSPYPGFSVIGAIGSFLGSAFGPSGIQFGLGIAMTAFTHTPWGWLGWGLNWLAQAVLFNHSNYYSHSTTVADWGLPHGGPRAFSGRGMTAQGMMGRGMTARGMTARGMTSRGVNRSDRTFGGYGRAGAGYGQARSPGQGFARARNQDGFAGNRGDTYNHNYQRSRASYGTMSRGFQPAIARSQTNRTQEYRSQEYGSQRYGNDRYASNSYGRSYSYARSSGSYNNRANSMYGGSTRSGSVRSGSIGSGSIRSGSMRSSRTPGAGFQRSDFGKRSSGGSKGYGFSGSSKKHSGGFHFGGGHAPKNSGGGKNFSHGHSGGGGHSGGHSGGGHHHH